jgi:hypothetical protein
MANNSESHTYTLGSLVRARERDCVVLHSDDPEIRNLWPHNGSESEACGVHLGLEPDSVKPSELLVPEPINS